MIRRLLLSLGTCLPMLHAMAQDGLWTPVSKNTIQPYSNGRAAVTSLPPNYELVKLNRGLLQQLQQRAPLVKLGERSYVSPAGFSLPLPVAGQSLASGLIESPILSTELSKQLTGFKTYELKDPATKMLQGRISVTSQGISGLIFTDKGSAYISPVPDNPDVHMVYYVKDVPVTQPFLCGANETAASNSGAGNRVSTVLASDCNLRNYRLAIAATGEYTQWAGSQALALTYVGILANDVTAIYERDAGITFTLVSNTSIMYPDPAADPYNPSGGSPTASNLNENQSALDAALGSGGYDLGIVVHNGWSGGLAQLNAVCNNAGKGRGAAGYTAGFGSNPTTGPQGTVFTGTVAHELAHEFSATHTMASGTFNCSGNTTVASAYEPGGGSTLMAYAGACGVDAYQNNSDLYFHGYSILQIANFSVNFATCQPGTPMSNSAPAVSVAAASYTIPVSTPFMLTATGTDANTPTLYYCWEQMDLPSAATSGAPLSTATVGPNFRSYPPTTSNTRMLPRIADLISGSTPFEVLPSVSRAMTFQVMVRDEASGGGCTAQTSVTVNTNTAAGPFTVTSQSSSTTWTANGTNTATVTWNVASTTAAPFNCSNVDILLSKDGGATFIDTLVANTANDGTESFTIPNLPTDAGLIMVKARGNIFFNINGAYVTITGSCSANGSTFTPGASVTATAGNASLDLSLSPVYGSAVAITGALSSTDPATGLSVQNASNGCNYYGLNKYTYDVFRFTPSVTGSYTFLRSGGTNGGCIYNLYSGDFNPGSPCENFISSSGHVDAGNSTTVGFPITVTLTRGLYYSMAIGTFAAGSPAVTPPAPYTINVTPPVGGGLFSALSSPGAGFNYTYVIVDNATGLIKAIDASSDLSNAANYPVGSNYTLYGLSYSNAVSQATLDTYAGTSFATFSDMLKYSPATLCGNVSANNLLVSVTATLSKSAQMQPLTATKAGSTVNLKWATNSSEKTGYYEIWRSADGTNFTQLIGTMPAQNTISPRIDYTLNDNSPLPAWNYYRVKQIDVDGNVTLSNIARVNMQENATQSILTVYPNPVKSASCTLSYTATSIETVGVRVLNSKGGLVYQSVFAAQTGANQYPIPTGNLAGGVYVVQLVSNSGSYTARFVKQ